jgi:hypothetical protein
MAAMNRHVSDLLDGTVYIIVQIEHQASYKCYLMLYAYLRFKYSLRLNRILTHNAMTIKAIIGIKNAAALLRAFSAAPELLSLRPNGSP